MPALLSTIASTVPMPVLCVLFIIACVLLSQAALSLFQKVFTSNNAGLNNEAAGIVFGGISLIYSLVLAFVIVAVWDDYRELEKTIEGETDKLTGILQHTEVLSDSIKISVQENVYGYCSEVINNEWETSTDNTAIEQPNTLRVLRSQLLTIDAHDRSESNILNVIDNELDALDDLRRNRLYHSHSEVPDMVWFILNAGSAMMVIFFFFFNVPSPKMKRIYLSFLVSFIAMCMFLVYTLDHPFSYKQGITNDLYKDVQNQLKDNGYIE
ncbi:DUF4239 domain-containing protein [Panacibacter sp. DH6]|uniref:DUF4239 domain-containing protein n=1 Tax=Panacibacter microcysteis TaxID=2793269 RepID=A0A931E7Y1_9BACT|nr:DUF4239 domain-containing protein [Panacibacter microcysteis]MBG9376925.1 DUF4239 domain-containing protein [Panacibacter microcysteis]